MKYLLFLIGLLCFIQCKKKDNIAEETAIFNNCKTADGAKFISIEAMFPTITECLEAGIIDSKEIGTNLIGEWELIAYGCGNCVGADRTDKITLTLEANKGILAICDDIDSYFEFDWKLEAHNNRFDPQSAFIFRTEPSHAYLKMDIFCSEFMFFNNRPYDGYTMLYQKQ